MARKVPSAIRKYRASVRDLQARGGRGEACLCDPFHDLLEEMARPLEMRVLREQPMETEDGTIVPDGQLRDKYNLIIGVWQAKSPDVNLEREIERKLRLCYPTYNTLFTSPDRAVLYQDDIRGKPVDLRDDTELELLLQRFLTHQAPRLKHFHRAVRDFTTRIPQHAGTLQPMLRAEAAGNPRFRAAFESFRELCHSALHRGVSDNEIVEMLSQHLLSERIFAWVFKDRQFVNRNPVARELEHVAYATRQFTREEFLEPLDRYYKAIEESADNIKAYKDKQYFLHALYEQFFQKHSTATADTHGVIYTPDQIVHWMVESVARLLNLEFGKCLSEPGVHVLDPCTGTGTFIVKVMEQIAVPHRLPDKYRNELHCNEMLPLPYYVAVQNIEHKYYDLTRDAVQFPGICFVDTLAMREPQLSAFEHDNTNRVQAQNATPMTVIIGNPPYNIGQKSENENNRNRAYKTVDARIRETYAKESTATNRKALRDMYVRFFRWATDRLEDRDGIVCFVTNSSFLDDFAFDGMRKSLVKEFSSIFVLDLGGNVRKNPKLSGTRHNVFGIQVGVAITLLVRHRQGRDPNRPAEVWYYALDEDWTRVQKLRFLNGSPDVDAIEWQRLRPDDRGTWLTSRLVDDFAAFLPLGTREAKRGEGGAAMFRQYGLGVVTNRDAWVYDFRRDALAERVRGFIETYNTEVSRWLHAGRPKDVDAFVLADERRIKWSRDLKADLRRLRYAAYDEVKLRTAMYRPFCARAYYFDPILSQDVFRQASFFPDAAAEAENRAICVTDAGAEKPFMALMVNRIPDIHLAGPGAGTQCFPFYTYAEDGTRRENLRGETVAAFRARYGEEVDGWDVFHYVYGLLHAPDYAARYRANLRRDLPRVPFVAPEAFDAFVAAGRRLAELHVGYADAEPHPLERVERAPFSWRVERMRLDAAAGELRVNDSLALRGIPPAALEYRVGSRSALEWVVDQHRVRTDARSGIVSDPNDPDHPEAIVQLVERIVTVSVETMKIIRSLPPLDPIP